MYIIIKLDLQTGSYIDRQIESDIQIGMGSSDMNRNPDKARQNQVYRHIDIDITNWNRQTDRYDEVR